MSFHFRPAIRENVSMIMGLIGASGSGKTYSAFRVATGLSDGKPFAVIDTEARRALHYAEMFKFDHAELNEPFRPDAYAEAIKAADDAKYPVIVVDSVSHVWAGESGVLDWHEEELQRMAGDDWKKREACKMAAWIKPKSSHKKMVQKLLQVKAHLILCFRAEEKMKMEKKGGKTVIVPIGYQPVCEKNLPFELLISFLLTPDKPGIPQPIKLQEQHKPAVDIKKKLDEDAGKKLLEWASSSKKKAPEKAKKEAEQEPEEKSEKTTSGSRHTWADKDRKRLFAMHKDKGLSKDEMTEFNKYLLMRVDSDYFTEENISEVFKNFDSYFGDFVDGGRE